MADPSPPVAATTRILMVAFMLYVAGCEDKARIIRVFQLRLLLKKSYFYLHPKVTRLFLFRLRGINKVNEREEISFRIVESFTLASP
jgi:hypothetical protein